MPRPHKPWYRSDRKTWYVEVNGKQIPLAKGPKAATQQEAYKAFNSLMERVDVPNGSFPCDSVISLLGKFLGWTKKHKAAATYEQRRHYLRSFVRFPKVKALRPERVTVDVVEDWLDNNPKWKASRRHAILTVLRAFNWAVKRGLLAKNPI